MKGYSSVQVLVRNATANSDDEISRDELDEICQQTYSNAEFFDVMDMLDKRINDKGKYWRHVAKSLTVLDYLVRFGSENCVLWCKENLYIIKTLKEFRYEDETGVDKGQIIRVKAKELTSLLMDDERLQEERKMNGRGNNRRQKSNRDSYDSDLQRAIEASKDTAADEEARRKREEEERLAAIPATIDKSLYVAENNDTVPVPVPIEQQQTFTNNNNIMIPPQQQHFAQQQQQYPPQQQQQYPPQQGIPPQQFQPQFHAQQYPPQMQMQNPGSYPPGAGPQY